MALTKERLAELLAKARENTATIKANAVANAGIHEVPAPATTLSAPTSTTGMHGEIITYNEKQQQIIDIAVSGKSCVLLGAAGTGKSTCQRGVVSTLIAHNKVPILADDGHKHLPPNTPGIVICAYTRRAVNNIRKVMPADMRGNCITIHKLLEYAPISYEETDVETGKLRKTMRFEPTRTTVRPLHHTIHTIIFEESSMIATELFQEVLSALHHKVQFIFIGDIQQLPPVFGSAILGYKMLELPVVELTEVYRQALESPIIRLAHHVLQGKTITAEELPSWEVPNKLKLHPWKKKLSTDLGILTIAKFFHVAMESGQYKPEEDMILIPFNKSFGTEEVNKHITQHLAVKRGEVVHEIIAGFEKYYYAVGDKVMYEKEDAIITNIAINGLYVGAKYLEASTTLDRWGNYRTPDTADKVEPSHVTTNPVEDIDAMLDAMSFIGGAGDEEERKREASHVITLQLLESEQEITVNTASALNGMLLGYAMTVHKAQGSEARKVFVVIHQSHSTMVMRELLYTAITRAREELYVICEPDTFEKGVLKQKIKGNTLAEKAEFFKGKVERNEQQSKLLPTQKGN